MNVYAALVIPTLLAAGVIQYEEESKRGVMYWDVPPVEDYEFDYGDGGGAGVPSVGIQDDHGGVTIPSTVVHDGTGSGGRKQSSINGSRKFEQVVLKIELI